MTVSRALISGLAVAGAVGGLALPAQADSLASTASSAGSASSGSVSASLNGSSDSSSRDRHRADGDYRVIDMAATPGRPGFARLTMQADDAGQQLVLDLPQAIVAQRRLALGTVVRAEHRAYGYAFAERGTREAFFLVLDDDWADDLQPRPVHL